MGSEEQQGSPPGRAFPISQGLLQALVESLPVNLVFKDLGGRILFANRRFCQESGRRPGELIGKTDFDLFPDELASKYRRDDADVLRRGQVLHDVEQHVTAEGDVRYVEVFKAPVRTAEGRDIGVQVLFWDVTERKMADEHLEDERVLLESLAGQLPKLSQRLDRRDLGAADETLDALKAALETTAKALGELAAANLQRGRDT